ncbi:putative baseplate assembly protein [[Eubacterium] cellulosolvens]
MTICSARARKHLMTPLSLENRPGLSNINYRVGKYDSFKNSMLHSILEESELQNWKVKLETDYGVAILSLWAYLGDILTFYQERIANEAYLRTMNHRENVIRLAAMLDYKLNPGVAASTYLAFILDEDATVKLPTKLLVQSVPGQDETPQKFETVESIEAYASLNQMSPETMETQYVLRRDKQVILAGDDTGLEPGDHILFVSEERYDNPGSERWDLRKLTSVDIDSVSKTTTVGWEEELGHWRVGFPTKEEKVEVYAMKHIAWPFGVNAPSYNLLPTTIICPQCGENAIDIPFPKDWTDKPLPEDENYPNQIFLDQVYKDIEPETWVALVTSEPPANFSGYSKYTELYRILNVDKTVRINYTLNSKVTRLTVDGIEDKENLIWPENIKYFPMQGTMILAQSKQLKLADLTIQEPLIGKKIVLGKYYPDLKSDRYLIVKGTLINTEATEAAECVQVDTAIPYENSTKTLVTLKTDLKNSYKIDTVKIYGNIAKATHGETISNEIIGSGDATIEFQEFTLKKSPITFVPEPNAPRGAENTLDIRVNDVLWKEVESLYGQLPNDRIYITRVNNDGTMTIRFGDGITGTRLPTGIDNLVAEYRQGLGAEGNVRAGTLKNLMNKPLGLKSAINPSPAEGGTDSESLEKARENAPNTVRTFDRAISLRDYEDLARNYTGIAKAKAVFIIIDQQEVIQLTIAGEDGAKIETNSQTYQNFVSYLELHRDINQPVSVISHNTKYLELTAIIEVDPNYIEKKVLAAANDAVLDYFSFDNLQLGQGIHLSNIYGVLQEIEGVSAARILHLYYKLDDNSNGSSNIIEPHLQIEPNQIAALNDDDLEIISGSTQKGE